MEEEEEEEEEVSKELFGPRAVGRHAVMVVPQCPRKPAVDTCVFVKCQSVCVCVFYSMKTKADIVTYTNKT